MSKRYKRFSYYGQVEFDKIINEQSNSESRLEILENEVDQVINDQSFCEVETNFTSETTEINWDEVMFDLIEPFDEDSFSGDEEFFDANCDIVDDIKCADNLAEEDVFDLPPMSLEQELASWATKFNVSLLCLTALLHILFVYHPCLPRSAKTLLKHESPCHSIVTSGFGKYLHFGLTEQIKKALKLGTTIGNSLSLILNIDGFDPFSSSKLSLWPILGYIQELKVRRPFTIGIYLGKSKPDDVDSYLAATIIELKELLAGGFAFCNKVYTVRLLCVICDAPARSMVKRSMGHGAIEACDYCTTKGIRHVNKTVYPNLTDSLRGEPGSKEAGSHFKEFSPFVGIIPLRDGFPPEYMHLICLGIMKRLLTYWIKPNQDLKLPCKLRSPTILLVSEKIEILSAYFPQEFQRQVRSLDCMDRWKASEYKNFLLYAGPIVLKGFLLPLFYDHFLLLHFSIYVFLDEELCVKYFDQASASLRRFIEQAEDLYTRDCLVYNMHVASHLPRFVQMYGPLHMWSAFPFENYIGFLQKRLRSSSHILMQAYHRTQELWMMEEPICNKPITFTTFSPNNCVVTSSGDVVMISETEGSCFSGFKMVFKNNLYLSPYPSSFLCIGIYDKSTIVMRDIQIKKKCISYPVKDGSCIVIPYASSTSFY